jgi:hypothetical protein
MEKKIIFYQSISEITEIIGLINKCPRDIYTIIVTGGPSLTRLIKKLKKRFSLRITIYEFQALKLINPLNILRMYYRFHFSREAKKIFNSYYSEVFFFNYSYDFVAPIFLCKIKSKKLTFINFYKRKLTKGYPGVKEIIQIFLIKILHRNINVKLIYDKKYRQIAYYPVGKKIKEASQLNKKIKPILEFSVLKSNKNKKNIIYFDSLEEKYTRDKNYKVILFKIFDLFIKSGFNIIIKKHPVADLSNCLKNIKKMDYILDPYPIELYRLHKVKSVFGLTSTSLAQVAEKYPNIKTFSFLDLLENKSPFFHFKYYLQKMHKSGKIYYPNSFNQIQDIIES